MIHVQENIAKKGPKENEATIYLKKKKKIKNYRFITVYFFFKYGTVVAYLN